MRKVRGQMSESLLLGAVLAIAGGFFDAYSYLCRGKVFANAQTGNIVLLGLSLAEGDVMRALTYLVPIVAFALGVIVAEIIKRKYKKKGVTSAIHWRQIVVLAEIVLVMAVAYMPQSLNMAANVCISFVCALQVETFRKVQGSAFATTMCTGNLRSGTEQLVIWRQTGDRGAARKVRNYYTIILYFILGAIAGTFSVRWMGERSLLLTCVLLLVVFFIMFVREVEEEEAELAEGKR